MNTNQIIGLFRADDTKNYSKFLSQNFYFSDPINFNSCNYKNRKQDYEDSHFNNMINTNKAHSFILSNKSPYKIYTLSFIAITKSNCRYLENNNIRKIKPKGKFISDIRKSKIATGRCLSYIDISKFIKLIENIRNKVKCNGIRLCPNIIMD